jgi:hypothetical protein
MIRLTSSFNYRSICKTTIWAVHNKQDGKRDEEGGDRMRVLLYAATLLGLLALSSGALTATRGLTVQLRESEAPGAAGVLRTTEQFSKGFVSSRTLFKVSANLIGYPVYRCLKHRRFCQ